MVVVEGVFVCTTYFFVCVLGFVFGLDCFWGFLVESWAWEKLFSMFLGSAWEMLGLPTSQVYALGINAKNGSGSISIVA